VGKGKLPWRHFSVNSALIPTQGRNRGGVGIPPLPSVPPERLPAEASVQAGSGGGQSGLAW